MENLVLMSFAVYSISPSDQAKILQSHYHVISRHPILQDYSCTWKFNCSCYYQWDLQIHLSAVTFTLKLLAHTLKFIRSQSAKVPKCDYSNRRSDITGSRLHRTLEIETISIVVNTEMKILQEIFLLVLFNLIESSLTCIGKP